MNTYSVLTCVLHEHFYLHHFIFYYQQLGFNKIYILLDKNQPDLFIDTSKFTINIIILPLYFPINIHDFGKIQLINFTNMIKQVIKEDWIFIVDVDEYLYLHGKSIHEYISEKENKINNLGQIQFPWMIVENYGKQTNNIFDNLKNNKWKTNDEIKSIIKRDAFVRIPDNHHCILKPKYITLHHNGFLTHEPRKRYFKLKHSIYYELKNPFLIHFHSRGLNNITLKILTYKYKNKSGLEQRRLFRECINSKKFHRLKINNKFKIIHEHLHLYKDINKFELILPEIPTEYLNNMENEFDFTKNLLNENNISLSNYNLLLENSHLIF